jgi:hypothetical protein
MKRFLALFILILFVTVSCAGPNKAEWTKRHFRQDEFEKDRDECMQTLNKNSYSQTSGLLADCLAWKGYEYTEPTSDKIISKNAEMANVAKNVGGALLLVGYFAAVVAGAFFLCFVCLL